MKKVKRDAEWAKREQMKKKPLSLKQFCEKELRIKLDPYIFLSSILALGCMLHLWYVVYLFYPYKQRGLCHFKKPSLLKFTINAMVPNHMRERL
jgi:hypothetical protein